jgi:hypothetical protein
MSWWADLVRSAPRFTIQLTGARHSRELTNRLERNALLAIRSFTTLLARRLLSAFLINDTSVLLIPGGTRRWSE